MKIKLDKVYCQTCSGHGSFLHGVPPSVRTVFCTNCNGTGNEALAVPEKLMERIVLELQDAAIAACEDIDDDAINALLDELVEKEP